MAKLVEVEGIGEAYAKKLHSAGITSTESLLKSGATQKDVKKLQKNLAYQIP
jgi:predicted flap endonuclease-1-like 5' DNA nuclease